MEAGQLPEHLQAGFLLPAGFGAQAVPLAAVPLDLLDLYLAQILRKAEAAR